MAAAAVTSNGGPAPGRLASVYSEVQTNRLLHALPLPSVLRSNFSVVDGPASSAAGNPGE
jgi:pyrophosphate--fructose-6-phosphate 1-phosphotransferase